MDRICAIGIAIFLIGLVLIDFGAIFGIIAGWVAASTFALEDPVQLAKEWWSVIKGENE